MSPLRECAMDEIAMWPEDQLAVVMNTLNHLKQNLLGNGATPKDPFYSSENQRFLEEGVQALNAGKGVEHDLIEV